MFVTRLLPFPLCNYGSPEGSTSNRNFSCGAGMAEPAAWYCPAGSGARLAVGDGYFSTDEAGDPTLRAGRLVCPAGVYCSGGVKVWGAAVTDCVSRVPCSLAEPTPPPGVDRAVQFRLSVQFR